MENKNYYIVQYNNKTFVNVQYQYDNINQAK